MNERKSDFEWLQRFARLGDQSAFRDLVQRHLDLVFATALHKTGDPGGAEEISQNVFGALARKAWQFAPDDSLPAWLHKTTLLECKSWLRGEIRRRLREQTAAELGTTMKTPSDQAASNSMIPLLDEALLSLREKDRTALLLRFYEKQSLKQVGTRLGVSEDTAQKRVQTALERVSEFFRRRGYKTATAVAAAAALQHMAVTTSAVTVGVVANAALQSAPQALAGMGLFLARFASLTKLQTAVACIGVAMLPLAWQAKDYQMAVKEAGRTGQELASATQSHATLEEEIQRLRATAERLDSDRSADRQREEREGEEVAKFKAWKERMRSRLLAGDYSWPEDSYFVRIPKSLLPEISMGKTVASGRITRTAREILGLAPEECRQLEGAIQKHLKTVGDLMTAQMIETNQTRILSVPETALARRVWSVPPLAAPVQESSTEMLATMKNILGEERWPLMEKGLGDFWTGTQSLQMRAETDEQEIAAWIYESEGRLMASCGWAGKRPHGGPYSTICAPVNLAWFLPQASATDKFFRDSSVNGDGLSFLPESVRNRMVSWLEQEALNRVNQEAVQ